MDEPNERCQLQKAMKLLEDSTHVELITGKGLRVERASACQGPAAMLCMECVVRGRMIGVLKELEGSGEVCDYKTSPPNCTF